jgi:DNA-binding response OmpR family regulator
MVESADYHVALIPVPNPPKRLRSDASILAEMSSVVVLPLTWKGLVTHLRSEGKRSRLNRETDVIGFGSVCVNLSSMEVRRDGKAVAVTAMEFKLLRYLIRNASRVISRDELLNEVWGFDNYPCTRTVDSHVWRLRKKLEADPASPAHFHTVHSVGYKFVL